MPTVVLKKGRARPFWYQHTWVFSGAVHRVEGAPADGDVVDLNDAEGRFVGRGFYNGTSQIRVRVCTWESEEAIDASFFDRKLSAAVALRRDLGLPNDETDCYRLVHGEGDGLPGLVVDVFARTAVVQFSALGLLRFEDAVLDALSDKLELDAIVEAPSEFSLEKEGIAEQARQEPRVLRGTMPDGGIEIRELGVRYGVDPIGGQKTGFYVDQRDNRQRLASLARGRRVLDAFCYSGAFGLVAALRGGAEEVLGIDTSERAVQTAQKNAERNGCDPTRVRFERADAREYLKNGDVGGRFDLISLDPPKLARSRNNVEKAAAKYSEINRLAIRAVARDGWLATCSCSQHIHPDDFVSILHEASRAEDRDLQIVERRSQGPDHPVRAACPESEYLKFVLCRVS